MPRPALSATRAVEIVNFLAGRPGEAFTLSEIVEQTGINLASVHALLAALTEADWLQRNPARKTYQLGSTLIAVGRSATADHPAVGRATDAAAALADELGVETIVTATAGADILPLAVAGRPDQLELRPRVGQRLPFMAPFALLWLAWDPPERIDEWLRRAHPDAKLQDCTTYRNLAIELRAAGYEAGLDNPIRDRIGMVLFELSRSPATPELHATLHDLIGQLDADKGLLTGPVDPEANYSLNYLGAPIFGPDAKPLLGFNLLGFSNPTPGHRLIGLAERLLEVTRHVTLATGGRLPLNLPERGR